MARNKKAKRPTTKSMPEHRKLLIAAYNKNPFRTEEEKEELAAEISEETGMPLTIAATESRWFEMTSRGEATAYDSAELRRIRVMAEPEKIAAIAAYKEEVEAAEILVAFSAAAFSKSA